MRESLDEPLENIHECEMELIGCCKSYWDRIVITAVFTVDYLDLSAERCVSFEWGDNGYSDGDWSVLWGQVLSL